MKTAQQIYSNHSNDPEWLEQWKKPCTCFNGLVPFCQDCPLKTCEHCNNEAMVTCKECNGTYKVPMTKKEIISDINEIQMEYASDN